jgi:hypothetical protein
VTEMTEQQRRVAELQAQRQAEECKRDSEYQAMWRAHNPASVRASRDKQSAKKREERANYRNRDLVSKL